MERPEDVVCVGVARNPVEAQLWVGALTAAGIPAYCGSGMLLNEVAVSRRLMNVNGTEVLVARGTVARAREVLAEDRAIDDAELEAQALAAGPVPEPAPPAALPAGTTSPAVRWIGFALAALVVALGGFAAWRRLRVPTEEEAVAFAEGLLRAVGAADRMGIAAMFDGEAMCERDHDVPDRDGVAQEVDHAVRSLLEVADGLHFLRTAPADGAVDLVFREEVPADVFDYLWLRLERRSGALRVCDLRRLSHGGRSLRAEAVAAWAESATMKELRLFVVPERGATSRDYPRMRQRFLALSDAGQRSAMANTLMLRLALITRAFDDYGEYLERLHASAAPGMLVDYFASMAYEAGQRDVALAAIDRIDRSVGGDPYLQDLRARIAQ
ncbi:MAG: hypothetical protein U1E73_13710 [Planctomycetota bacterium]